MEDEEEAEEEEEEAEAEDDACLASDCWLLAGALSLRRNDCTVISV